MNNKQLKLAIKIGLDKAYQLAKIQKICKQSKTYYTELY